MKKMTIRSMSRLLIGVVLSAVLVLSGCGGTTSSS